MTAPEVPPGDLEALLAVRRHVAIAHHVPGRIRLRFDPVPVARAVGGSGERMRALLSRIRGIAGVEINLPARSLTVHYDPAALPQESWERLLAAEADAATQLLAGLLGPSSAAVT